MLVAHHAWRLYRAARERHGGVAGEIYETWLDEQARIMGIAYNATMALVIRAREAKLAEVEAEETWRSHFEVPLTQPRPPDVN